MQCEAQNEPALNSLGFFSRHIGEAIPKRLARRRRPAKPGERRLWPAAKRVPPCENALNIARMLHTLGRLTCELTANYSVPMESELNSLDEKLSELIKLCQRLRKDNLDLRQELDSALNQNRQLTEKIESARSRLAALVSQIPDDGI
jgi:uncharacterized protein (TIGR02449 family)